MATVTGFTSARMLAIENETVVDGNIVGNNLILVRRDAVTIDAGNVRGPVGPQGPSGDVGDIKANIRSSIPGYLALNGQAIAGADIAYPGLWTVVPTSWKSGTTLNLPDMTDRITQGGGVIGAIDNANTQTLVNANLPPHAHTGPDHTHSTPNHTHTITHTHTIGHGHSATSSSAGSHTHDGAVRADTHTGPDGGVTYIGVPGSTQATIVLADGLHAHPITVTAHAGNSGAASTASTGSGGSAITGSGGTGSTGNGPGTSTPVNVQQQALRVNYFIRY